MIFMVRLNHLIAALAMAFGMAAAATSACAAPSYDVSFAGASQGSTPADSLPPAVPATLLTAVDASFDARSSDSTSGTNRHEQEQEMHLRRGATVVPEPGTPLLLLAGVTIMVLSTRRGRQPAPL
jgi:hypothetical protein